jgi:VanZ family protein
MTGKTRFRIRRPWLALCAMYVALIFFASSLPYLRAPGPDFQLKDKLAHCVEYGVLGWLMSRAMSPARGVPAAVEVLWFVAAGASIAALDEVFQGTVAGRVTDVTDWTADVIGLALGSALSVVRAHGKRFVA